MRCEVYKQFGVTVICEALQSSSSADIIADTIGLHLKNLNLAIVDAKLFLDL